MWIESGRDYREELKSKQMADRQRATAMYLIDVLALRAGNEKGEDEADTVGCCSLRCEHVTLEPPNILCFDFLGKDSIRYYKRVEVDPQVFKNMRIFKQNKTDEDASTRSCSGEYRVSELLEGHLPPGFDRLRS
jgi:DNA topoisomerase-1